MSTAAKHEHHQIDYIELCVTDLEAAKRFYGAAFGWTFTDYGPAYVGFTDAGRDREGGGFVAQGEVRHGGVLVILYSHALEDTLAAVREAGGGITKDVFTFPGGRRFQFTDPSGNELAVWSDR